MVFGDFQYYVSLRQFWQIKSSLFIHSTSLGLILELSRNFPIVLNIDTDQDGDAVL